MFLNVRNLSLQKHPSVEEDLSLKIEVNDQTIWNTAKKEKKEPLLHKPY